MRRFLRSHTSLRMTPPRGPPIIWLRAACLVVPTLTPSCSACWPTRSTAAGAMMAGCCCSDCSVCPIWPPWPARAWALARAPCSPVEAPSQQRAGLRRIAALGDMLELGAQENAYHAGVAEDVIRANIDLVFCAGPRMKHLWDALPHVQRGAYATTSAELAPILAQAVQAGDVVMVKGSNGSKMAEVVRALQALEAPAGES